MYVGDRDTYNDVFCMECGNIADRETLNADGVCEYCLEEQTIQNIKIQTEMTLEQAVKIYDALKPVGQREFFGNLSNAEAKHLQTAIREKHQKRKERCVCFACIVFIE